jgi:hypothetical protein
MNKKNGYVLKLGEDELFILVEGLELFIEDERKELLTQMNIEAEWRSITKKMTQIVSASNLFDRIGEMRRGS